MVIADRTSGRSVEDIRSAARPLETTGIRVIAVSVGKETDPEKLKSASWDDSLISSPVRGNPKQLGEEIMAKILEGEWLSLIRSYNPAVM